MSILRKLAAKLPSDWMASFSLWVILLSGLISLACTTRVSEWVLLNALQEKYTLISYHNTLSSEKVNRQNNALKEKFKHANLNVSSVIKEDLKQPYYALYYKNKFLEKYTDYNDINHLATSPLREKIAVELLEGKLCVLLFLKSGDEAKDYNRLQILQNTLKSSPLKDIITIVESDRNNREEAQFTSLLLNVEDDLKNIREPMLFGIFGKFKALEPLLAGGITEENINLMIDYLKAECSCLIKDDLPGKDILFSGNWENPKPALLNKLIDENPLLGK
jgi:hypothetical protein